MESNSSFNSEKCNFNDIELEEQMNDNSSNQHIEKGKEVISYKAESDGSYLTNIQLRTAKPPREKKIRFKEETESEKASENLRKPKVNF